MAADRRPPPALTSCEGLAALCAPEVDALVDQRSTFGGTAYTYENLGFCPG